MIAICRRLQSRPSSAVEKLKKVSHIRMPQRRVVISRATVPEAFAQMHNRNDGNVRGSAQDESHRETGEKSESATKRTHLLSGFRNALSKEQAFHTSPVLINWEPIPRGQVFWCLLASGPSRAEAQQEQVECFVGYWCPTGMPHAKRLTVGRMPQSDEIDLWMSSSLLITAIFKQDWRKACLLVEFFRRMGRK